MQMTRKHIVVAIGVLMLATLGGSLIWRQHGRGTGDPVSLQPGKSDVVALGYSIYAEHCASCHGVNLEGQADWRQRLPNGRLPAPPHDETGHTWHHADQVLFDLTKFGPSALLGGDYESDMPGYEGILGDDDIIAVLSFIKSRWPKELQKRHDQLNARQE